MHVGLRNASFTGHRPSPGPRSSPREPPRGGLRTHRNRLRSARRISFATNEIQLGLLVVVFRGTSIRRTAGSGARSRCSAAVGAPSCALRSPDLISRIAQAAGDEHTLALVQHRARDQLMATALRSGFLDCWAMPVVHRSATEHQETGLPIMVPPFTRTTARKTRTAASSSSAVRDLLPRGIGDPHDARLAFMDLIGFNVPPGRLKQGAALALRAPRPRAHYLARPENGPRPRPDASAPTPLDPDKPSEPGRSYPSSPEDHAMFGLHPLSRHASGFGIAVAASRRGCGENSISGRPRCHLSRVAGFDHLKRRWSRPGRKPTGLQPECGRPWWDRKRPRRRRRVHRSTATDSGRQPRDRRAKGNTANAFSLPHSPFGPRICTRPRNRRNPVRSPGSQPTTMRLRMAGMRPTTALPRDFM